MKLLWIGDMHVQVSNLDESQRLFDWLSSVAANKSVDAVVFAGDQYNDFGIKRVEVDEFWHKNLASLKTLKKKVYLITGNHDLNSDGSSSALTVLSGDGVIVVDKPVKICGDIGMIPFIRDNNEFTKALTSLHSQGAEVVYCHQEFNGCQYENGFYAPHGADLNLIPDGVAVISGHIHKKQKVGKVFYPGTPRHLNRSDIGEVKGIYLFDGRESEFFQTPANVASPFKEVIITEAGITVDGIKSELSFDQIKKNFDSRTYVDIKGSKEFVIGAAGLVPDSAKIRTFIASQEVKTVSESNGIPLAFVQFAKEYIKDKKLDDNTAMSVISKVYEKCPILRMGL